MLFGSDKMVHKDQNWIGWPGSILILTDKRLLWERDKKQYKYNNWNISEGLRGEEI